MKTGRRGDGAKVVTFHAPGLRLSPSPLHTVSPSSPVSPSDLIRPGVKEMRRITSCLSCLLVASLVFVCVVPSGAARASAGVTPEGQQSGGASEEREQGRALLHRGRAAEALIHLERALKAFQSSSDRVGEAATQDLLGELYERQGQYDTALTHYRAAHDLYAAGAASGGSSKAPLPGAAGAAAGAAAATAASLTTEESSYNAQLMLAKIGNMLFRRGDLAGARAAYAQMNVKKPDTSAAGKAKRSKGLLGGLGLGIGSDNKSVQIGAPTLGGLLTVKEQLNLYRQSILYAGYEMGQGRVDFKDQQFDSARKHFENVLSEIGRAHV